LDAYDKTGVALDIADLTRTEYHSPRIAQSIHWDVNFAVQVALAAPNAQTPLRAGNAARPDE
jgi:hypothetical protein